MAFIEIPLENGTPSFTFFTALNGSDYSFEFRWNGRLECWIFDMYDNENNPLFLGKPFQTDVLFLRQVPDTSKPSGDMWCGNNKTPYVDSDRFAVGVDVLFYYLEGE